MNCKHFGECGSCTIYNISYQEELENKKRRVLSKLSHFGIESLEIFSDVNSNYRARAEFRIWHNDNGISYAMGRLDKKGSINIDECPKVISSIESRMKPLLNIVALSKILKDRQLLYVNYPIAKND